MLTKTLPYIAAVWLSVLGMAYGSEVDDARVVALDILQQLEQKKNLEVWNTRVSRYFKDRMTQEAFLANMTIMQAQLGGAGTDRVLIQQNSINSPPGTEYLGKVYSFLFGTRFPRGKIYEMIVMIFEDNAYRLSGIHYIPNPN